ncbi:MAG: FtsX-like permease family protein, partial [Acidobacteriaceae bacterium]|nr:FtsX-like permease family protein [Acidobacteriaceae bacterium]
IGKGLGPQFVDDPREIVGVVGDVHEVSLSDKDIGVMYIPESQVPEGITQLANSVIPLSWAIRSNMDPLSLRTAVQKEIQAIDGLMPIAKVRSMDEVLAAGTTRQNFNMLLLSIFAGIALVLAAIGIYGLMSYSVEQQTQEVGIRMALGARNGQVLQMIVKQGMLPASLGLLAGLLVAYGATRVLSSLLFGVKSTDPLSFVAVAAVLAVVALVATYIPARRALMVDPVIALRQE